MRQTRRRLLAGMVLGFLATGGIPDAHAILFSGAPAISPPPSGQLTTLSLTNTSGSTQTTNFITPMFGHAFKKGDIPSGTAPIFKTPGGASCAFSMSTNIATWSDGSLMFAAFALLYPTSIAGNATQSVGVYSGGTVPSVSSRTTADFAAGSLDLNIVAVGLDNISGTWTSNLNQGISALGADWVYMDGAAGKVWRCTANFRQSSADHGQLLTWWYVWAMQDNSGNLAGVRYLGCITQPYYNKTSPYPDFRSFSSVLVKNGASTIKDIWANVPNNLTFAAAGGGSPALFTTTNPNNLETGWLVRVSNSGGSLPGTLQANTSYFCSGATDSGLGPDGFTVNTWSFPNGTGINMASAGSGTNTLVTYPYVTQFGGLTTAGTKGKWDFIQGGGSFSADCTVRAIPNFTYLRSTGLIDPYDYTTYSGVTSNPSYTYTPMTAGPIGRSFNATGEGENIGPNPAYNVRYLFTGAEVDETCLRIVGLFVAQMPVNLRDQTTKAPPCVNNGHNNSGSTYTGMPAPDPFFRWQGAAANASGLTLPGCVVTCSATAGIMTVTSVDQGARIYASPATSAVGRGAQVIAQLTGTPGGAGTYQLDGTQSWTSVSTTISSCAMFAGGGGTDTTHIPNFITLPWLIFGEPQFMDGAANMVVNAVGSRYVGSGTSSVSTSGGVNAIGGNNGGQRNNTVNGTTYAGIAVGGDDLMRCDAWANRDMLNGFMLPDSFPGVSGFKTYAKDMSNDTVTAALAFIAQQGTTWATTNGVWNETDNVDGGVSDSWASSYFMHAVCRAVKVTENANWLTFLNYLLKWPAYVNTTFGTGWVNYYQAVIRQSPDSRTTPYLNSGVGVGFQGWNASWSNSASPSFTDSIDPSGPTSVVLTNGDIRVWNGANGNIEGPVPGGFNSNQAYYVINANSGTGKYDLASSIGGTRIVPSDNNSITGGHLYGWSSTLSAPNSVSQPAIGGGRGYMANIMAALFNAHSVGATIDATLYSQYQSIFNAQSPVGNIDSSPTYAMGPTA